MIIIKIIGTVLAMSIFFMYWALPIQVCALALYYFVIKKRMGRFLNPYVKLDMLVPFIVVVAWSGIGLYFSQNGKSLANVLELFWLGVVWSSTIIIRFSLICICRRKNKLVCLYGDIAVIIFAALSAIFFPALPE